MSTPVFFTIVSRNYLAYAITLLQSVAEQYPDAHRYLCLADTPEDDASLDSPFFELVTIDQLSLPNFKAFAFRYDIMELNTAVKPYMFEWLRKRHPQQGLLYIDPDIIVLRRLSHVEQAFAEGASLVLTPHLNAPMSDDLLPDELSIMRSGVYNCGFVAINAAHPSAGKIIEWWSEKLEFQCFSDLEAGLFTDQKWMDMAPGLFPDVSILRNDGYNVAYWNLAQRPVQRAADGGYTAGGVPLVFAHFSGVALSNPKAFSKHQNRFTYDDIGGLRPLYDHYLNMLDVNGHLAHSRKAYRYGSFDDGEKINQSMRRVYRRFFDVDGANAITDPFVMDRSVFNAACEELPVDEQLPVSRLMYDVWSGRTDLQEAFDIRTRSGRDGFIRWYLATAEIELGFSQKYIEPIRQQFARAESGTVAQEEGGGQAKALEKSPLGPVMLRALTWGGRQPALARWYSKLPVGLRSFVRARTYALNGIEFSQSQMPARSTTKREPKRRLNQPSATTSVSSNEAGVNLVGYARGEFGVAENVRSYARALESIKYAFIIRNFDIGVAGRQNDLSMEKYFSETLRYDVNVFFINADQMAVAHDGIGSQAFVGRYNIGYWLWELSNFPDAWDGSFDFVDEVWAPTKFVRDAVAARTTKPVLRIPKAIEFDVPSHVGRSYFQLDAEEFIFLYSYDFNSYASRKNPEAAIAAFRLAFADGVHKVRLLIKSINGQRFPERLQQLVDAVSGDSRIEIRDGFLMREEMFGLQNAVDCYVSLHRAEGFGLGMAESMYLSKPVIATGYSGNMDFMTKDNSCLVDYTLVPLEEGDYPFWQGQYWAEADVEHAARYMRRMLDETGYAEAIGAAGARSIRETNSKKVCAEAVAARLATVARIREKK